MKEKFKGVNWSNLISGIYLFTAGFALPLYITDGNYFRIVVLSLLSLWCIYDLVVSPKKHTHTDIEVGIDVNSTKRRGSGF